jgi:hypothetical protein
MQAKAPLVALLASIVIATVHARSKAASPVCVTVVR